LALGPPALGVGSVGSSAGWCVEYTLKPYRPCCGPDGGFDMRWNTLDQGHGVGGLLGPDQASHQGVISGFGSSCSDSTSCIPISVVRFPAPRRPLGGFQRHMAYTLTDQHAPDPPVRPTCPRRPERVVKSGWAVVAIRRRPSRGQDVKVYIEV